MTRVLNVFVLLGTIAVVQGLCNFPSDFVGITYDSLYRLNPSLVYTFEGTKMIGTIEDQDGGPLIAFIADCLVQNGDFFMAASETGYICYKFVSTDSLTPRFYEIGSISPKTGNPTLCDVCANMLNEPIPFVFRARWPKAEYPKQLPVGCNIPIECPLTNSGTPCTPEITLDGLCSELLEILEEECLESSESSSSSSSSEEVGVGAGRRAFGKRGKGKKPKGKYNSKEKCKKYEQLEALIKETYVSEDEISVCRTKYVP